MRSSQFPTHTRAIRPTTTRVRLSYPLSWMRVWPMRINLSIRVCHADTLPFSGSHLMPIRDGSGIFLATTEDGWSRLARKTAMAGLSGLWELCWAAREMLDCAVRQEDSLRLQCRQH